VSEAGCHLMTGLLEHASGGSSDMHLLPDPYILILTGTGLLIALVA